VLPDPVEYNRAERLPFQYGITTDELRPTSGGPTAAWPPATCSPPPSSQPRHHRPPGTRAL